MTETKRIRWEPTKYGGWTGHAGTVNGFMFQVWKPAPFGEKPYRLESSLPDEFGRIADGDDPDALKAEAEEWLERFISSLGAIFPEAVLKLADDWRAVGCPESAEEEALMWQQIECGEALREAISRELSGTRQTQPGEDGES